jgi:hypothetical protein
MREATLVEIVELTEEELDAVSAGASSNFTTETPSGNPTQGQGEGLVVVNQGGNAPPGQQ